MEHFLKSLVFINVSVTCSFFTPLLLLAPSFTFDAIITVECVQIFEKHVKNSPENTRTSNHNRQWRTEITWNGDELTRFHSSSFCSDPWFGWHWCFSSSSFWSHWLALANFYARLLEVPGHQIPDYMSFTVFWII